MFSDNKKKVQDWIARIDRAKKKRKEWESEWEDNYRAVYGTGWMKGEKRESLPVLSRNIKYNFDLLLSFLKTELPSLVLYRPEVFLTARQSGEQSDPAAQKEAKLIETKVNQILADMDGFETEVRCALIDAHIAYGIMKVLPKYEIKSHPKAGQQVIDEETGEPIFDPVTGEPLLYPEEEITSPSYDICRVDPFKFLIDERAKNLLYRCPWVGEEIDRTLEDLKLSGLYDEELIAKLEDKLKEKNRDKKDWEIELTLYEIYDRVNNKIIVICDEWQDDFLRYEDTPACIEKDPYVVLKYNEIPGQWFPKPDISSGKLLQEEYRKGREWQQEWVQKSKPLLGVKPNVDEYEREKIRDGVSDLITLTSENDVFLVNKDAINVNPSLTEYMGICLKDFDHVMGQSSQDRGFVGVAKFATEAQIAEAQGNLRLQDKLNVTKLFLEKIIEKLLFLIKNNPAESEEIRNILLNLDLDIEIDIESKTPKNKAIERKQLIEVMQVVAGNPVFMQSPTLLDQILRDYDIREREKIITELQQAVQNLSQPQKPGLNLSLQLKHELLPTEAVDKIVDMIMQADIPIVPRGTNGGNGKKPDLALSEPVGAGTEGMEPGSGMMPSGEVI